MLKCQEKNEKYTCLGITAKLMCAAPSRFSQCFDPLFYLFYLLELKCGLGIRHSFCPASLSLELSQLCQCKHLLFSLLICAFRLTSLPSWLYWKHSRRAVSIRNGYCTQSYLCSSTLLAFSPEFCSQCCCVAKSETAKMKLAASKWITLASFWTGQLLVFCRVASLQTASLLSHFVISLVHRLNKQRAPKVLFAFLNFSSSRWVSY